MEQRSANPSQTAVFSADCIPRPLSVSVIRTMAVMAALTALLPNAFAEVKKVQPLTGCASETPPFLLTRNGAGVSGFSFDVFQNMAQQMGRGAKVRDLPWARCLQEVKAGRIDVAIDAYDDAERRKVFHYSQAYYTLTPQVFYLGTAARRNLPSNTVQELAALKGCGVHEYTYEHYDLDAATMDLGASNDLQMLQKLKLGRCDYAVEELEYVIGGRNHDPHWLDETGILSFRPSWARAPSVHFLVSKARPDGDALVSSLNAAIAKGKSNGFFKMLQMRYFQTQPKSGK